MATNVERNKLIEAYPFSKDWKYKVQKMTDEQVMAIFYSFKKKGKIK